MPASAVTVTLIRVDALRSTWWPSSSAAASAGEMATDARGSTGTAFTVVRRTSAGASTAYDVVPLENAASARSDSSSAFRSASDARIDAGLAGGVGRADPRSA